jgi:predicted transcriptional regulator of viral defense system
MTREIPQALRDIADQQRGVIARRQASEAGLSEDTIRSRLRGGAWCVLQPGVYATFTGEPCREAMLWAAVLRAGTSAALSHQTAAELSGLTDRRGSLIHLTVPRQRHIARIPGVVIHRSDRIAGAYHPCLTPPRTRLEETVIDLVEAARSFEDACDWLYRACGGRLTTPQRLLQAIESRKKIGWRDDMRAVLSDIGDGALSGLERRYLNGVERSHGLPRAERQARNSRGGRVRYRDNLYAEYGVVVEIDGRVAHPGETRWGDARRDNAAAAEGLVTLRYNFADVFGRPCQVAVEVGTVLSVHGWPGALRRCGPSCAVAIL